MGNFSKGEDRRGEERREEEERKRKKKRRKEGEKGEKEEKKTKGQTIVHWGKKRVIEILKKEDFDVKILGSFSNRACEAAKLMEQYTSLQ